MTVDVLVIRRNTFEKVVICSSLCRAGVARFDRFALKGIRDEVYRVIRCSWLNEGARVFTHGEAQRGNPRNFVTSSACDRMPNLMKHFLRCVRTVWIERFSSSAISCKRRPSTIAFATAASAAVNP